jgi:hypothetical protein
MASGIEQAGSSLAEVNEETSVQAAPAQNVLEVFEPEGRDDQIAIDVSSPKQLLYFPAMLTGKARPSKG